MAEPLLALEDVRAGYGDAVVLDGVSLEVPEQGSLAVLGRNGVGKSTLLLTIMGYTTVARGSRLDPSADEWRLRTKERHRLALHVRAHQRPRRVVVLEERNQRRRHAYELPRGDVHVVDLVGLDVDDLAALRASQHVVAREVSALVDRLVGLRDDVAVFLVGREVVDLLGNPAVDDLPVRSLDEPVVVDTRERLRHARIA
jgi:Fe-S cluster assembly ATPase SufC